jgi:hypothetical protein
MLLVAAVGAGLGAAGLPATAGAATTYCSPTGDVCYGLVGSPPPVRLGITLAGHFFTRYRLCVTGPDGGTDCHSFSVHAAPHGLFRSIVRWSRHFPNRGHGLYRARWRSGGHALGPPTTFSRHGGPTIRVRPSTVHAGNHVRVFGYAGGCPTGDQVTLISRAFPHTHDFAGLPAVFARVQPGDRYSVLVRIPRGRRPGSYTITARCGGGNFGISRTLRVLAP